MNTLSYLNNPKLVKVCCIFAKQGFSSGNGLRSLFELNDDGSHIVAADTSYMILIILNTVSVDAKLSEGFDHQNHSPFTFYPDSDLQTLLTRRCDI